MVLTLYSRIFYEFHQVKTYLLMLAARHVMRNTLFTIKTSWRHASDPLASFCRIPPAVSRFLFRPFPPSKTVRLGRPGVLHMSFTHADVQNIIQLLDSSHFDELVLEMNGIKLELRRNGATSSSPSAPAPSTATTTWPPSPGQAPSAPPSAPAASSSATEDASA